MSRRLPELPTIPRIFALAWSLALAAVFTLPMAAQRPSDEALKAQLLASPPPAMVELARRASRPDHPAAIDVMFEDADLDGSRKFNFIVAFFFIAEGGQSGFLRVFNKTPNGLTVAGDQDDELFNGGGLATLTLVDVKGDGIPAVEIDGTGYSGKITSFALYSWTGSSLHLITDDVETASAFLADIDGDGQLELITPFFQNPADLPEGTEPKVVGYHIYKLRDGNYQFLRDSATDPTGELDAKGDLAFLRFQARIEPSRFPFQQIRRALAGKDHDGDADRDDAVRVTLRNLRAPGNKRVPIDELNPGTLVLDRNLKPLRVTLRPADHDEDRNKEGADRDDGAQILQAEFSRLAFFKLLKRFQLSKPLEAGDKITVIVHSKLKDGRSARGGVSVTIAGERDRDEHRDKD